MTPSISKSVWRTIQCASVAGVLVISACDDSSGPRDPVGSYSATTLITTEGGLPFDHIANGSTIDIVLNPQRTTHGTMHIEAFGGDPDFDADLTGTWTQTGSTVRFSQAEDTFLNDMDFTYAGNTLVGDDTFAGTRIQVTLTRD